MHEQARFHDDVQGRLAREVPKRSASQYFRFDESNSQTGTAGILIAEADFKNFK